jgi:hypothetical protein
VSYRITSHVNDGYITAEIDPPTRTSPESLVLRLRHPDGKKIHSVLVNGHRHRAFDSVQETVTIKRKSGRVSVRVNYQ